MRWLGVDSLAMFRVLDLASYHAIVACVAAGSGIALMPESVLAAMPHRGYAASDAKGPILVTTPLTWRRGEINASVLALRMQLASRRKESRAA